MEDRIRSGARGRKRDRRNVVAIASFALACSFALPSFARSKSDEVMAVQSAIESNNRAYAMALEAGDAHAFSTLFVDDAVSLPPFGPLIRGRTAIEASVSAALARVHFVDASMHTVETRIMGDTVVELGTYRLLIQVDGRPTTLSGRYLTVWRHDGRDWKIAVDSSQPDVSAEPDGSASSTHQAKE